MNTQRAAITKPSALTATKEINGVIVRQNIEMVELGIASERYWNACNQLEREGYELVKSDDEAARVQRVFYRRYKKIKDRDLPPVFITIGLAY